MGISMHPLQLACKSCGKAIPAGNVNIAKAIAKCEACDAVFGFMDVLASDRLRCGEKLQQPAAFEVDVWGPELTLTRRWYSHGLWALLAFCIFWDGFLAVWYAIGIREVLAEKGGTVGPDWWAGLIMLVFPVFHLALGVGLTYAVISGFVNRTVVRVAGGELSVWHGPLPWPGNQRLLTTDIQQLYCAEARRPAGDSGCSKTFNLLAVTGKNDEVTLLSCLDDLEHGLFIEQQLERHLKIQDQWVPGQVRV